jgi:hypothetical protein
MQSMKILEGDVVLLSQPMLIEQFGRAGAQFLSQLHYWLNHNQNLGINYKGTTWIYNSAESWARQLHLSVRQVRRLISKFINCEILKVEKLNPHKSVRTNYYSIDYNKLNASLSSRQSSKTRTFTHSDILSPSSCHNGTIYNDTKITNKDLNKSEKNEFEGNSNKQLSKSSFKQVKDLKNISEKIREESQKFKASEIERNCSKKDADNIEVKEIFKASVNETLPKTKADNIEVKEIFKASVNETLPKTKTAQSMLKVWNNTFDVNEKMSKELAPLLVSAYNSKFLKNINNWQDYALQIKSSVYLTSDKFNLSIFWALKFSIIDRIRVGEFGVAKPATNSHILEKVMSKSEIESIISSSTENEECKVLRNKILEAVGEREYISWFMQAIFQTSEEKIILKAPNAFVASVWEKNYDWLIK